MSRTRPSLGMARRRTDRDTRRHGGHEPNVLGTHHPHVAKTLRRDATRGGPLTQQLRVTARERGDLGQGQILGLAVHRYPSGASPPAPGGRYHLAVGSSGVWRGHLRDTGACALRAFGRAGPGQSIVKASGSW